MLKGRATPEGTEAYTAAHAPFTYRPLDETGLLVSAAGFGGYRVDTSADIFHEALSRALRAGINVIDTSSNYADGGSEELVGMVMRRLHDGGEVPRNAVVVVSKGGYLQGENYQISQRRKAQGRPFPDLVEVGEGLEHCIHPDFLQDQLTRSLDRLQMETLDVYLLHNPEYYLSWADSQGVPLHEAREEYYRRIALAFDHLEGEVAAGRIGAYGISSNTFPAPADDATHTSLARVWETAQSLSSGEHHFRVIQLPANLLETGMVTEANQPQGASVLEFAREHHLGVLVNRPLNAIGQEGLVRLAEVPVTGEADAQHVADRLQRLAEVEARFSAEVRPILKELGAGRGELRRLENAFGAGGLLQSRWRGFGDYHRWRDVATRFLVPQVQGAVQYVMEQEEVPQEVRAWLGAYVDAFNEALRAVGAVYAREQRQQAQAIKEKVQPIDADWAEAETLSQMALRALRSTAGISTVLVGMRREAYVEDVLAELRRDVSSEPRQASWQALAETDLVDGQPS